MKKLFIISVFLIPILSLNSQTSTAPSAGDGTAGDPYQISTLENLYWLSQTNAVWGNGNYFIQTTDIDASETASWSGGAGFPPIAYGSGFEGNYDGQGYKISNLFINSTEFTTGLFSFTEGGCQISNLGIENCSITGTNYVGALVGQVGDNTTITNCYSSGSISGLTNIGGLIGRARPTYNYNTNDIIVEYCYSSADIHCLGYGNIGGLIGWFVMAAEPKIAIQLEQYILTAAVDLPCMQVD